MVISIQKCVSSKAAPTALTAEEYEKLLNSELVKALATKVAEARMSYNKVLNEVSDEKDERVVTEHEKLKAEVANAKKFAPVVMYNAGFNGPARRTEYTVPTGMVMLDFDHVGDPRMFYQSHAFHAQGLKPALIAPTISGEGLRAVYEIPEEVYSMAKSRNDVLATAMEYIVAKTGGGAYLDRSCKDWPRSAFVTPLDEAFYYDRDVMFPEPDRDIISLWREKYPHLLDSPAERTVKSSAIVLPVARSAGDSIAHPTEEGQEAALSMTYNGLPLTDIVDSYYKVQGSEPVEGERNIRLFNLARDLRCLVGDNKEVLRAVMKPYGLPDGEFTRIIDNACKLTSASMSDDMRKAIDNLQKEENKTEMTQKINVLPQAPKKLPDVLELCCNGAPAEKRGSIALACVTALGAYVERAQVYYPGGFYKEPVLISHIVGASSSGKSCIDLPVERVLSVIRERDEEANKAISEWQDVVRGLGANSNRPKKPRVCRQITRYRVTEASLTEWLVNADGKRLIAVCKEQSYINRLAGGTARAKTDGAGLMKKSYDVDRWGSSRVSAEAIDAEAIARINFIIAVQPKVLTDYFRGFHADGTSTRIALSVLPSHVGEPLVEMPEWTPDHQAALNEFCERIASYRGNFRVPELLAHYREEMEPYTCMMACRNAENPAYDTFRRRSMEMAISIGFILYLSNGCHYSDEIREYQNYFLEHDLAAKMIFFADDWMRECSTDTTRPRRVFDIYNELPNEFTSQQVRDLRIKYNCNDSNPKTLIGSWHNRGKVITIGRGLYRKTDGN